MSAERVRKYREKLNLEENKEKKIAYLERKKISDGTYREKQLKISNGYVFKNKKRLQMVKLRENVEINKLNILKTIENNIGYKTSSELSKAASKVMKALPNNEHKTVQVLEKVVKKFPLNIDQHDHNVSTKISRQRKYFIGNADLVRDFFNLDDVSRQFPGKRDFVTIKNGNGEKIHYQKRLMIMTVDEAFAKFLEKYPECKISRSKFFALRPKYILLLQQTPHNMCVCFYCSNFEFLFLALKPWISIDARSLHDFLRIFKCDNNFQCASNCCDNCKDYDAILNDLLLQGCENERVNWKKWIKIESQVQKVDMKEKKVADAIKEFQESFKAFKRVRID